MSKTVQFKMIPTVVTGLLLCVTGLFWSQEEPRGPLTVAVNIWPGAEGLLTTRATAPTKSRRINFVEMSWSTASMGAFRRQVVDVALLTPDELLRLEDEGAQPRAVLILGISKGSDAILARPGLSSMQDLRGRRVGVEPRSMTQYLLLHALAANGMTLQDVKVVSLNVTEMEAAYDEKDVDAVVTADPWRVRLQDQGAVVVFDSSKLGLEQSRLLVVRADALEDYSQELQALVSAHLEMQVKSGGLGVESGLDAILRREGLTPQQWRRALEQIQIPDAAENLRLLGAGAGGLEECMKSMSALMRREHLLTQEVETGGLIHSQFVKAWRP